MGVMVNSPYMGKAGLKSSTVFWGFRVIIVATWAPKPFSNDEVKAPISGYGGIPNP